MGQDHECGCRLSQGRWTLCDKHERRRTKMPINNPDSWVCHTKDLTKKSLPANCVECGKPIVYNPDPNITTNTPKICIECFNKNNPPTPPKSFIKTSIGMIQSPNGGWLLKKDVKESYLTKEEVLEAINHTLTCDRRQDPDETPCGHCTNELLAKDLKEDLRL